MKVDARCLARALRMVLHSMGGDGSRPNLRACSFEYDEEKNGLSLVTTDGHRLTRCTINCEAEGSWDDVVIRDDEVERLLANLKRQTGDVVLEPTIGGLVVGRYGTFLAMDDDLVFPKYQKVIPDRKSLENTLAVPGGVTARYIVDALSAFDELLGDRGTVVIQPISNALGPIRMDAETDDFMVTVVIMPRRI